MLGDLGPLTFTRTTTIQGNPPPKPNPLREEFELLDSTSPRKMCEDEAAFLRKFGVNKASSLGNDPSLILLGEPHLVDRKGKRLIVSKVLNSELKTWGRLQNVPGGGDGKSFIDTTLDPGFYGGGGLAPQYFVHAEEDGVNFYNYITAGVVNEGILFNCHAPDFGQSVFHELMHTFEGTQLTASTILKEGIVEKYSRLFVMHVYGLAVPVYAPYLMYYLEAEKLILLTDLEVVAKAYFADDGDALKKLVPYFYKPINATLGSEHQLNSETVLQGGGTQSVKGFLSPYKMKEQGSWYRDWVSKHDDKVPKDGLALPVATARVGLKFNPK